MNVKLRKREREREKEIFLGVDHKTLFRRESLCIGHDMIVSYSSASTKYNSHIHNTRLIEKLNAKY